MMFKEKTEQTFALLEYIIHNNLFSCKIIAREDEIIVDNSEDAEIFSTDQDIDLNKGKIYKYRTMILEDEARTGELFNYLNEKKSYNLIQEIDNQFNNLINNHLKVEYDKHQSNLALYDVLCGEFYNVYVNLMVFQEQNALHAKMLDVFKRGGMLCGWKGPYPKGEVLIFPLASPIE